MNDRAARSLDQWKEVARAHARDIYQTPDWATLDLHIQPGDPHLLEIQGSGTSHWVPLVLRRWHGQPFAWSPYGYPGVVRGRSDSLQASALVEAVARALQQQKIVGAFIRLHPILDRDLLPGQYQDGCVVEHGPTASVDLSEGLSTAWSSLRARLRTDIRRLERNGFTATTDWRYYEDFVSAYSQTMRRVGATGNYFFGPPYWRALQRLPAGWVHLVSVLDPDGQYAAGGLFTVFGEIAQYHLGATRDEHLAAIPSRLLFWEAARLSYESRAKVLHLGGGVGAQRDGLYQLKRGFGRRELDFRTLRVVADWDSYKRQGGSMASLSANTFPPAC